MAHFNIVIVGAGLSGIGCARYLQQKCPNKSLVLLEGRERIGGTWDLFRYPGIRSDSDMHTLGYAFKPWEGGKALADGPSILDYIKETAEENHITDHIRFNRQVTSARWSTSESRWTLDVEHGNGGGRDRYTCDMLLLCGGYYRYDRGHAPGFKDADTFEGQVVHPQFWPEDLDYAGKSIIVIGSGATAITLVPALAKDAASVTMVQRSPSYVYSMPSVDHDAERLRKYLPSTLAYAITRWRNIRLNQYYYYQSREEVEKTKQDLIYLVREALGPDYDVEKHFTPRYNPWDQRLCLIPDDDLYDAINSGKAVVVTDEIDRFTAGGLKLKSGEELKADIIISATGLELNVANGIDFSVDEKPVNFAETFSYKGMMFSDVPNLIQATGYFNASWTLKIDLTAEYICRLLKLMDKRGMRQATPRLRDVEDADLQAMTWNDEFTAGYIKRAQHLFPKQGDRAPWQQTGDFYADKKMIRDAPLEDGALRLSNPVDTSKERVATTPATSERPAA
ncbi:MAG: NAD(P)/FAD-dependent oxidoreductase [Pseudomonadota bacterium]